MSDTFLCWHCNVPGQPCYGATVRKENYPDCEAFGKAMNQKQYETKKACEDVCDQGWTPLKPLFPPPLKCGMCNELFGTCRQVLTSEKSCKDLHRPGSGVIFYDSLAQCKERCKKAPPIQPIRAQCWSCEPDGNCTSWFADGPSCPKRLGVYSSQDACEKDCGVLQPLRPPKRRVPVWVWVVGGLVVVALITAVLVYFYGGAL